MRFGQSALQLAVMLALLCSAQGFGITAQAPSLTTEGDSAHLEWESYPDWYLQYSTTEMFNGPWKRVSGTENSSDASVLLLEDRYFFRLVAGNAFEEVTLPYSGGTITLDNGLVITVPAGAWSTDDGSQADLHVLLRLLEPVEADSIIMNTGMLNKVFLGGFEIKLVDDLTLYWYQPVSVKFPAIEPLGDRTLPLGATLNLEHGIFNLNPTNLTYNFDAETLEMHIPDLLPTVPGNDYRVYQDSLIYCVVGVNPDPGTVETMSHVEAFELMTQEANPADGIVLPPDHPCREGDFNIAEGSLDFMDSAGCQFTIIKGSVVWLQCGNQPIYESYEVRELESKYIEAKLSSPTLSIGETSILIVNLVHSKGKALDGLPLYFESLTQDIVVVENPHSGLLRGVSCGPGKILITGPCNLNKTVEVKVESMVEEILVSETEVVLDFDESVFVDVTLLDGDGKEVTNESSTVYPKETSFYNVEQLGSDVRIDAKQKAGTGAVVVKSGCIDSDGNQLTSDPIAIKVVEPALSIQPTSVLLGIDESVPINVSLLGKNDTPLPKDEINWSSTFGDSCSFDTTNYTLTALDHGAGVLKAEYKGIIAICNVVVAGDLVLNPTEADIHVGEELNIEVYMFDAGGNQIPVEDHLKNILWSVSPGDVISFDAGNLRVTGLELGTAELTASIGQQSFTSIINVVPPSVRVHWSAYHGGSGDMGYSTGNAYASGGARSGGYWSGNIKLIWIDGSYKLYSSIMSGGQSGRLQYYTIGYSPDGYYNAESKMEYMNSTVYHDPRDYASSIESWANSTDFNADQIVNPLFYVSTPMAHYFHSVTLAWEWTGGSDSSFGSDSWDEPLGASLLGGITGLGFLTGIPEEYFLQASSAGSAYSGSFSMEDSFGLTLASRYTPFNFSIHYQVFVFVDN